MQLNADPKILSFLIGEGVIPIFLFVDKVVNEVTSSVFELQTYCIFTPHLAY